jgi:hypothetical protein
MAYLVVYFAPPVRGADSTASHLITRQSLAIVNRDYSTERSAKKGVFEFCLFKIEVQYLFLELQYSI